jgi:thioredoxin 1
MVPALTTEDFRQEVIDSAVPVLVSFWSLARPACRRIAPVTDELATESGGRFRAR